MLKVVFLLLLIANVALFALNRSASSTVDASREPERLKNQLNADRMRLRPVPSSSNSAAQTAAAPTTPAPQPASPQQPPQPQPIACLQIGELSAADADQLTSQLAELQLGDTLTRQAVRETGSYIVFIPSQGGKEAADRKTEELQRLGVTDYFVIQEGPLQWGISLGIFKSEDAARTHMAMLTQKGVRTARIAARKTSTNRFVLQLRDLPAEKRARVDELKAAFPAAAVGDCKAPQTEPTIIASKTN